MADKAELIGKENPAEGHGFRGLNTVPTLADV